VVFSRRICAARNAGNRSSNIMCAAIAPHDLRNFGPEAFFFAMVISC
jgi:hypothetical protein